jgi:hypothetical protein
MNDVYKFPDEIEKPDKAEATPEQDEADEKLVIEIEDVLLASMQPSGAAASICLNMSNLSEVFSVAASTTKSAFFTPSALDVLVIILLSVVFF